MLRFPALVLAVLLLGAIARPGVAAGGGCLAMASDAPRILPAAALAAGEVRLTYIGHSSFIIESPQGVRIVTDYAGYSAGIVPDVVTMNRAHSSHFTEAPDPAIRHVLRGWDPAGGIAQHDLTVGDVRIRNVTTDIRGGEAGRMPDGNSIFVFEIADLCIGHLGHLHHDLGIEHLGRIGRLDVVLVPVDGTYTMAQAAMLGVLRTLKARVVIPMHYFGPSTLARFVGSVDGDLAVAWSTTPDVVLSADALPGTAQLLVLPVN